MENATAEALEHADHASHAAHTGDRMLMLVSVTIAVLAVAAATVGSLEGIEAGFAIARKNESILAQDKATDVWAMYQAQSVKRNLYEIAAQTNPALAGAFSPKAQDYAADQEKSRAEAEKLERDREAALASGEVHETRHHVLTAGATLLHVAIAVATIAIILRGRRWPWYASIALGIVGVLVAGAAYLR